MTPYYDLWLAYDAQYSGLMLALVGIGLAQYVIYVIAQRSWIGAAALTAVLAGVLWLTGQVLA